MRLGRMRLPLLPIFSLLALQTFTPFAEGCSSRSTPKPRPTLPTSRPNVTFHTFACPSPYSEYYCLNGATCFLVKIGESHLYNCICTEGYMGPRCEFKDLDGSYLQKRQVLLETASIASGATIAVILVVIICMIVYMHFQRKHKQNSGVCEVDGVGSDPEKRAPFSRRDLSSIPLRTIPSESKCQLPIGDTLTESLYASVEVPPASVHPP